MKGFILLTLAVVVSCTSGFVKRQAEVINQFGGYKPPSFEGFGNIPSNVGDFDKYTSGLGGNSEGSSAGASSAASSSTKRRRQAEVINQFGGYKPPSFEGFGNIPSNVGEFDKYTNGLGGGNNGGSSAGASSAAASSSKRRRQAEVINQLGGYKPPSFEGFGNIPSNVGEFDKYTNGFGGGNTGSGSEGSTAGATSAASSSSYKKRRQAEVINQFGGYKPPSFEGFGNIPSNVGDFDKYTSGLGGNSEGSSAGASSAASSSTKRRRQAEVINQFGGYKPPSFEGFGNIPSNVGDFDKYTSGLGGNNEGSSAGASSAASSSTKRRRQAEAINQFAAYKPPSFEGFGNIPSNVGDFDKYTSGLGGNNEGSSAGASSAAASSTKRRRQAEVINQFGGYKPPSFEGFGNIPSNVGDFDKYTSGLGGNSEGSSAGASSAASSSTKRRRQAEVINQFGGYKPPSFEGFGNIPSNVGDFDKYTSGLGGNSEGSSAGASSAASSSTKRRRQAEVINQFGGYKPPSFEGFGNIPSNVGDFDKYTSGLGGNSEGSSAGASSAAASSTKRRRQAEVINQFGGYKPPSFEGFGNIPSNVGDFDKYTSGLGGNSEGSSAGASSAAASSTKRRRQAEVINQFNGYKPPSFEGFGNLPTNMGEFTNNISGGGTEGGSSAEPESTSG